MTNTNQYRKIRSTMMLHGVTNQQIAAQEKVTENYVTFVITGRRVGYRIRKAIAAACGVKVTDLWPGDESELPKAA